MDIHPGSVCTLEQRHRYEENVETGDEEDVSICTITYFCCGMKKRAEKENGLLAHFQSFVFAFLPFLYF